MELMAPVEQQLEWLSNQGAVSDDPAIRRARIAHAVTPPRGTALGIEILILFEETIPDGSRDSVAERLGARVAGIYSCQEIGAIAYECEAVSYFHVAAENALVGSSTIRGAMLRLAGWDELL